jgi:hypothetical protein
VLILSLLGCGAAPACSGPDAVFAESGEEQLTCREAAPAREALALLKGHVLPAKVGDALDSEIASEFRSDPAAARARLRAAAAMVARLRAAQDVEAAEMRATHAWEVQAGEHPFVKDDEPLRTIAASAMSVWTKDDTERLVLTESDIEGWVRYGSLCGEAQQRGSLKISVADRVGIYSDEKTRFLQADRPTKLSILTVGAFWTTLHDAWPGVSYDQQQEWTSKGVFPPPMEATSLGYLDALLDTDPNAHATAIIEAFGPLFLGPPAAAAAPAGHEP